MAARAPSGRQTSLPKSWDEMTGQVEPESTAGKSNNSSSSGQNGSLPAVPAVPVGKLHVVNTNISRRVPAKRGSFWHEHKNAALTIAVILCPTISMLVLLVLARSMHPFEGKFYEGRTVSQWVSLLGDEDPMLRSQAFETIVKLGDEATPQLARALRDPEVERRRDAALAMQKIRPKDKRASEALAGALQDKDLWVRWRSAQALRAMGPNARAAVSPLATALTDDDPRVRCAAAQALGRIGKEAMIAQPALISAMKDERTYVRRAASAAMENIMAEVNR